MWIAIGIVVLLAALVYGVLVHAGTLDAAERLAERLTDGGEADGVVPCDVVDCRTIGCAAADGPAVEAVVLRAICAACKMVLREGTPGAETSHGLCQACLTQSLVDLREWLAVKAEVSDAVVDAVSERIGMYPGAWDCVPAAEIIAASVTEFNRAKKGRE